MLLLDYIDLPQNSIHYSSHFFHNIQKALLFPYKKEKKWE